MYVRTANAARRETLHTGEMQKLAIAQILIYSMIFVTATKLLPPVGTGHLLVLIIAELSMFSVYTFNTY